MTRAIRLVVADPRRLIAEALALAVLGEPTFEIVATLWGNIEPRAIAERSPDMILLGVGADEGPALALVDALSRRLPAAEIVLVADSPTRRLLSAVLGRSLGGLLLTDHPATDLVAGLADIARGQAVLPNGWQAALARPAPEPLDRLSDRQLEVLRLLAEGCSYEEIGVRLFISVNTVKFHTRSIFERLGVHNRMAAVRLLIAAQQTAPASERGPLPACTRRAQSVPRESVSFDSEPAGRTDAAPECRSSTMTQ